jgi:hypothetical protein
MYQAFGHTFATYTNLKENNVIISTGRGGFPDGKHLNALQKHYISCKTRLTRWIDL